MAQRTQAERREDRREIRQAASDGNISRREVRQLTNSGATERQINNVAARNDATVQRQQVNLMPSPRQASSGAGGGQGPVNAGGISQSPRQASSGAGGGQGSVNAGGQSGSPSTGTWQNSIGAQYVRPADMYGMGSANEGVFSGASWNQMKAGGYSDDQIRDYLTSMNGSGLKLGTRVQDVMDNYDSYMTPVVPNMPGMTDPRTGKDIPASNGSRPDIFFMPVNTEGVNNMWGNPLGNGIGTSQVIGDGVNWQDPSAAGELARYYSPQKRMEYIDNAFAMSQANPNLVKNMNAFVDSGHVESLLTGTTPTANPTGWSELYNSSYASAQPKTSWGQAYADQLAYQAPSWQMPKTTTGKRR